MNEVTQEVSHTIRDDTAARHLHKYTNSNPLHRLTLGRFFSRLTQILNAQNAKSVFEFGCGEGLLLRELKDRGFSCDKLIGIDLRADAIAHAEALHPEWKFAAANLFTWTPLTQTALTQTALTQTALTSSEPQPRLDHMFDLVIASQVLEHIPDPAPILIRLLELTSGTLVLTVPCEPWFQLMNFLRGRDLMRLGNHPEHTNRWSRSSFVKFVEQHAEIISSEVVFPFTVVVAKRRVKEPSARAERKSRV